MLIIEDAHGNKYVRITEDPTKLELTIAPISSMRILSKVLQSMGIYEFSSLNDIRLDILRDHCRMDCPYTFQVKILPLHEARHEYNKIVLVSTLSRIVIHEKNSSY